MVYRHDFRDANGEVRTMLSNRPEDRYSAFWRPDDGEERPDDEPDFKAVQERLRRGFIIEEIREEMSLLRGASSDHPQWQLTTAQVKAATGLESHLAYGIANFHFDAFDTPDLEQVLEAFRAFRLSILAEQFSQLDDEPERLRESGLD